LERRGAKPVRSRDPDAGKYFFVTVGANPVNVSEPEPGVRFVVVNARPSGQRLNGRLAARNQGRR